MRKREDVIIQPIGFDAPIEVAVRELRGYLGRVGAASVKAERPVGAMPPDSRAGIVLGTTGSLSGLGLGRLPEASVLDDAFAIIPKRERLWLVGSNPRSVLFAAYRLLEELGVVFLRPGPGGEIVPSRARLPLPTRAIREAASYRHRGICIEGSPRMEHVLDTLDWMAKKKMNCFQIQFRHGGAFWRRGYVKSPETDEATREKGLSVDDYLAIDERVVARMKELGMMLHKVGHGWTANTLGYPGMSWRERPDHPLHREKESWPALVNGRSDFFRGEPTNTELCYSNPEVRCAFIDEVLLYARQHSEVDFLHVWLSDATNNKCECPDCRRKTSTDWYMLLVNELDRRVKEEGLRSKIVFLAYQELIWPPEIETSIPDDVVLMYAPMGRCYRHPFTDPECGDLSGVKPPQLNEFRALRGNRAPAELSRQWKKLDPPDTFLFDYYGWGAMWRDGFGMDIGASMPRDMRDLKELGLNGHVSCQCIRAYYPLPLWPNAMADYLWGTRQSAPAYRKSLMSSAFGKQAEAVEKYFAALVAAFPAPDHFDYTAIVAGDPATHRAAFARIEKLAAKAIERFAAAARREREAAVKLSLELVALHAEHAGIIANSYLAGIAGDRKRVANLRSAYENRLPQFLARYSLWIDPMIADPVLQALGEAERLTHVAAKA